MGVLLVGVANKTAVSAALVGLTKQFEAQWSKFFEEFVVLSVAQMPKFWDLAICVNEVTDGQK